jgi:hypothetical protein
MFDLIKNITVNRNRYRTHSEAVVISCFYNPQNSAYRLKAFDTWYESIKHLNHRIIECVIGDTQPQLGKYNDPNITVVYTENLLWHKETLLNKIVSKLPKQFKYVFWVDADVIFTNLDWLIDGVETLKTNYIIQPFEFCAHLNKDEIKPKNYMVFINQCKDVSRGITTTKPTVWRSFSANYVDRNFTHCHNSKNYNVHGHVGFAWGSKREVLDAVPLYDRALIGGADHIIAHASTGEIGHVCITKSFTDVIDEVNEWSRRFYSIVRGRVGYVKGNIYHLWHGDIENRQYLKRIQDFTPVTKQITKRDDNGLYVTDDGSNHQYIQDYFHVREMTTTIEDIFDTVTTIDTNIQDDYIPQDDFQGFDGGSSEGGGESGSWDEYPIEVNDDTLENNDITTDVIDTDNFS